MDNDQNPQQPGSMPEPTPMAPEIPPTTEIQQPTATPPEGEMKSLEEISGIKSQIENASTPIEAPTEAPDSEALEEKSKTDTHSKLTRIAAPIVVAVAIIAVGYVAYSLFLSGTPEDTTTESESDAPPALNLAPPEEDILGEDIPVNLDENELEDALKEGLEPAEPVEPEPSTPKVPSIKPKS